MYYEICISLNGIHLFATAERSITSKSKLKEVYEILKEKFPEKEGYKINVTKWRTAGEFVNMEETSEA